MTHTIDKTTCFGFTKEEFDSFKQRYDQDKFNQRMVMIARIFEYDVFLSIDEKILSKNPYYYNDQFDRLYDMNFYELEELEQEMHDSVESYGRILKLHY